MKCKECTSTKLVKNGLQFNGNQRYRCKQCGKRQQDEYAYTACVDNDVEFVRLLKENVGIRSLGRILNVSSSTVLRRILKIAQPLSYKEIIPLNESYEVDELFTFIGNKKNRICIAY